MPLSLVLSLLLTFDPCHRPKARWRTGDTDSCDDFCQNGVGSIAASFFSELRVVLGMRDCIKLKAVPILFLR